MNDQSIQYALWVTIAANLSAAIRFVQSGLHRRYPVFTVFLIVQFISSALIQLYKPSSAGYFYVYVYTTPLIWILYVLIVRELYSLVLRDYPGIYSMMRWSMYGVVALAVCISLLSVVVTFRQAAGAHSKISYYYLIERGIVFALVLFIVSMLWFLSRYPVRLSRNILIHCFLYSALFLCDAALLLVQSLTLMRYTAMLNLALLTISAACFTGWAALFSKKGEGELVRVRHYQDSMDEDRLLSELNSINSTLLRAARR